MSDASIPRIERQLEPLREKIVKALREAILSEHLKPGQRLVERDLCEQTGVSRSSIREALRYLESEGLIERGGATGMFVTVLDPKQAMEIYEVRAALEAEAARHFAERASPEDIAALKAAFQQVDKASRSDAYAYGREIDHFYEILFAGAKNATAETLIRPLRARINLMRNATSRMASSARLKASMAQMKLIVNALERRDPEAAATACRQYVARSIEFAKIYFRELEEKAKKEPAAPPAKLARSVTRNR
jgi:DNA-binding GntR family transcriptional regulator